MVQEHKNGTFKKYISEIIKNKQIDFSGNGEEKREYICKRCCKVTASLLESDEKNIARILP